MAPVPAARPTAAAEPFSTERREMPFFFISVIDCYSLLLPQPHGRGGELVDVGPVPVDDGEVAGGDRPLVEGALGDDRGQLLVAVGDRG